MPPVVCERCRMFKRRLGKRCFNCRFQFVFLVGAMVLGVASAQAQSITPISKLTNEPGPTALAGDAVATESLACPLQQNVPGNCRTTIQQIINTPGSLQYAPTSSPVINGGSLTNTVVTNALVTPTGGSQMTLADALANSGGGCSANCTFTGTTTLTTLGVSGTTTLATTNVSGTTTLTSATSPLNIAMGVSTGSPTTVYGISITPTNWTVQGSAGSDCAVCVHTGSGNSAGFNYGIRIGDDGLDLPIATTGALIETAFTGSTVATGIDFGWVTFTNSLLHTPPTWVNRSVLNDALFIVTELGTDGTNVNQLTLEAAPTTVGAALAATGNDTNISLNLVPKGTGVVQIKGTSGVNCSANTVSLTTLVVTGGIVTHC